MGETNEPKVTNESEKKGAPLPLRQILIETDGNDIKIAKAEVSGKIELIAVLQNVINYLNNTKK